jgi:hypothetical protein
VVRHRQHQAGVFEGGVLLLNAATNTFDNPCAGIPTARLYRDTTLSFPFNGNGPVQEDRGQRPFKQRMSMSNITGSFQNGADSTGPRLSTRV